VNINATDDLFGAVRPVLGDYGADVGIECFGAAPAAGSILNLLRRGARFSQMGLYGKPIPFDQDQVCSNFDPAHSGLRVELFAVALEKIGRVGPWMADFISRFRPPFLTGP